MVYICNKHMRIARLGQHLDIFLILGLLLCSCVCVCGMSVSACVVCVCVTFSEQWCIWTNAYVSLSQTQTHTQTQIHKHRHTVIHTHTYIQTLAHAHAHTLLIIWLGYWQGVLSQQTSTHITVKVNRLAFVKQTRRKSWQTARRQIGL